MTILPIPLPPLQRRKLRHSFLHICHLPLGCVIDISHLPSPNFHPVFCPKPVGSPSQYTVPPFAWGLRFKLLVPSLISAHSPNSIDEVSFPRRLRLSVLFFHTLISHHPLSGIRPSVARSVALFCFFLEKLDFKFSGDIS